MEVSSHSLFLLQQLNVQREFGFLCDCTVAIGNVYFKAHRAVLAAFSNYFKMIFIHQSRWGSVTCPSHHYSPPSSLNFNQIIFIWNEGETIQNLIKANTKTVSYVANQQVLRQNDSSSCFI